jgi:hypothetical protein
LIASGRVPKTLRILFFNLKLDGLPAPETELKVITGWAAGPPPLVFLARQPRDHEFVVGRVFHVRPTVATISLHSGRSGTRMRQSSILRIARHPDRAYS